MSVDWPVNRRDERRQSAGAMTLSARKPAAAPQPARASVAAPFDLASLVELIRRNLLQIAVTTLLALALGITYLAFAKPSFTAISAVFVDPRQRRIVSEDMAPAGFGSEAALFESQLSIIASDAILRRAVIAEKLDNDPEFVPPPPAPGLKEKLRAMLRGPRVAADPVLQAMDTLARAVRVRRAQSSYVINVSVTADSAVKAARLANAIVAAYMEDQSAAKAEAAARANKAIDSRLDELKAQVRAAEMRADTFKRSNRLVTSEGGLLNEQQLTRLNTELVAVRAQAAATKARFDEMTTTLRRGASPEALPEAMASPVVQRLREQLAAATRREAALSSQLQSRHPVMVDAQAQVTSLRGQISAELRRISDQVENEYQIAVGREREILKTLGESEREVAATTTAQIKLREFEREADASREILRAFLARAKETEEQRNVSLADARVITPAAIPTGPTWPNVPIVLALSLMAGLSIAGLRTLLSAFSAPLTAAPSAGRGLALDEDPLPLKTLGTIPRLGVRGRFGTRGAATPEDIVTALSTGTRKEDVSFRHEVTAVASRVRVFGTNQAPHVVLMVAEAQNAGTSMSALSIAYARASAGERALLVDASSADPALSMLLAGDLQQDEPCVLDSRDHLAAITTRDAHSGLVFLPIALADLPGLTLGQRQRLSTGLARLFADYDLVVIDGGAVGNDPSASIVAHLAGSVVCVTADAAAQTGVQAALATALGIEPRRVVGVIEAMTPSRAT